MSVELWRNNPNGGKTEGFGDKPSSTTLSAVNPTSICMGSNLVFRGEWTASVIKMQGTSSLRYNGSLSV